MSIRRIPDARSRADVTPTVQHPPISDVSIESVCPGVARWIMTSLVVLSQTLACCAAVAAASEQTILEYGAQCRKEIGRVPAFDCNRGIEIPITVNERPLEHYESGMKCDRPSLFVPDKAWQPQCMPHSRVLNLSDGKKQISAYCRRNVLRDASDDHYDAVDVVLHDTRTGKTCWFHAEPTPANTINTTKSTAPGKPVAASASAASDTGGLDASRVPPPDETDTPSGKIAAADFWKPPAYTAGKHCAACHDAGPYIYSPFIGQVWDSVPTDPFGKYENIGADFASWARSFSINTRGNTCTGCHRIGDQQSCRWYIPFSVGCLTAQGDNDWAHQYPHDHWMPVSDVSGQTWDAANIRSVHDILACCQDREHKNPNCIYAAITTGPLKDKPNDKWTSVTDNPPGQRPAQQCVSPGPAKSN